MSTKVQQIKFSNREYWKNGLSVTVFIYNSAKKKMIMSGKWKIKRKQ